MMSIEDILHALPSKEDLAAAVGLQPRASTTGDILTAFGLFGTGMILGAGLALLFAPMAGHEIRDGIAEKVGEIGDHLRAQAPEPATPADGPST
jgi:hypothetical protein